MRVFFSSHPSLLCHRQVLELCDMGTLKDAARERVFHSAVPDFQEQQQAGGSSAHGSPPLPSGQQQRPDASADLPSAVDVVNMEAVLQTLLEVASALSYLHCMGIVHCDIKVCDG